jgi:glycosyltransferase involved in cell wall biosynthesis
MRILIVSPFRCHLGGVERYLEAILPGLLKRGYDLALLYRYSVPAGSERIDPPRSPRAWCLQEQDPAGVLRAVAEWNPDVVYSHGMVDDSLFIEDALLSAYPSILYLHNYDRTCASGRKSHAFPQPQMCTRQFGPACLMLYYPRRCGGIHRGTMLRLFARARRQNEQLHRYAAVLVASRAMYDGLLRHDLPEGKTHLVRYPATDVIAPDQPPERKRLTGRILFLGRLTGLKGVDYLVRAVPRAAQILGRPVTVTIAGEGPESDKLQDLAARLRASVTFAGWAGWAGTRDKTSLIHASDLLVVPSIWPEPFGLVGIEAGSFGVPAAGYAVGGICDWLTPGENGELARADPPAVEGLAQAIGRALRSPEYYGQLSRGAWEVARRFTLTSHLDRLDAIFAEIGGSRLAAIA